MPQLTINRRRLLQDIAAILLASAAAPQSRPQPNPAERFAGIQMGPHSMLDEGVGRVLDRLQESTASTRCWSTATLITLPMASAASARPTFWPRTTGFRLAI